MTSSATTAARILANLGPAKLVEYAIRRGEGHLTDRGAFTAVTVPHTGRSPKDKFVVEDGETAGAVWWDKNARMSPAHFELLQADVEAHLAGQDLFQQDLFAGADQTYRLPVRFLGPNAWQMLFVRNMFIRPTPAELATFLPEFRVLHAPEFQADPARHGTATGTFIALHFAKRTVLIGGTRYAGELKKSIFTVLNWLLPRRNVFPMHCSANVGAAGDVAVFFGLSGTGKTTLSADPTRRLIGDDEHGWSDRGVFNFEGGCYAKVIRLSAAGEPEIHAATQMFGTVLENVVLDLDDPLADVRRGHDHREHPRQLPDRLHPEPRAGRHGRAPEDGHLPDGRRLRRAAADRAAHAAAGDVPLPLGLHRQGRGHGAGRDGADRHLLRLLRRAVPAAASGRLRQDARRADRGARRTRAGSSTPAGPAAPYGDRLTA